MPPLFNPIMEVSRGMKTYWRGVQWLKAHPKYLVLLFVPTVLALLLVGTGFGFFIKYDEVVFQAVLFAKPTAWWALSVYYVLKGLLYLSFFLLSFLGFILMANVLASPVYDMVSFAVERDFSSEAVAGPSLWQSLLLLGEELKKVFFIILVSVLLFLIPGLNLLTMFVTAFLVGWDFYDYPLARRGWTFKQRWQFVMKDFWAVMGLGVWMMIPVVNLILVPLAVAGGTILNLEALKRQGIQNKL